MAITSITISQKNITDAINLLSVHNPLVFCMAEQVICYLLVVIE